MQAYSMMALSDTKRALPGHQGLYTKSTPTTFRYP